LNLASSAATVSGPFLDLTLPLSFTPAFAGAKLVYATVSNGSGLSSGWVQPGAWTVAGAGNQPPSSLSVSPSSAGGIRQLFTIQFSDADGDVEEGGLTVGHSPSAPDSCTLSFSRAANRVLLAGNDGTAWSAAAPGAAATLGNSQCTLRLATSTFTAGAAVWTVTADLEFNPGWSGNKGLFLYAVDGGGNGGAWTPAGSYRVGGSTGSAPGLSSITQPNSSGSGGLFEVAYWDADGSTDISAVTVLFNGPHSGSNGCLILADRRYGSFYLASDDGKAWNGGTAGQPVQIQNSQCSVDLAASTFAYSGTTLKVRPYVNFKPAFNGAKTIWSHAADQSGRASPPLAWSGSYTVASSPN